MDDEVRAERRGSGAMCTARLLFNLPQLAFRLRPPSCLATQRLALAHHHGSRLVRSRSRYITPITGPMCCSIQCSLQSQSKLFHPVQSDTPHSSKYKLGGLPTTQTTQQSLPSSWRNKTCLVLTHALSGSRY